MENTTTPETAVETSDASLDARIAAKFGFTDDSPEPEAEAQPEPEKESAPQDPDALSPDEVTPEDTSNELELIHDGQQVRVPKEEAVKLAQQGYDYTKKTQALAEERRALEAEKEALKARATLTPQLVKAAGKIEALGQQLEAYKQIDWPSLAAQDPSNYPAHHANFVKLQSEYQKAYAEMTDVWGKTQTVDRQLSEADLAKSWNRMLEKIPVWRDETRRVSEQTKVAKFLESEDFSAEELKTINDPRLVSIARKAMLFDEAIKARGEKSKQITQAPAVKPGVAPVRVSQEVKRQELVKSLHQAKDPTRKKALFDEILANKFGLK